MTELIIFGHADADGHVIAEQTRRNLSRLKCFDVSCVVDPYYTEGHRAWNRLVEYELEPSPDIIVFVDMMFSPASFSKEANGLLQFAEKHSSSRIIIIDHHPLPLSKLAFAENVIPIYRPIVADCTIGPRENLMVLAALDENQADTVSDRILGFYRDIVIGLRRAAAPSGALQGELLMSLLQHDYWPLLLALGRDDKTFHRLVRGRRPKNDPTSEFYDQLILSANALAKGDVNAHNQLKDLFEHSGVEMAFDAVNQTFVAKTRSDEDEKNSPLPTKDLEAIVTLLEIAAITLTDKPDATFSKAELLACARDYAGDEIEIEDTDVELVLEKASFVKNNAGSLHLV